MFYKIKKYDDLEKINESVLVQSQVKALRLKDKLGKQNVFEVMKKGLESVTKILKDVSQDVTKTMGGNSKENDRIRTHLNAKPLEIKNARCMIATYLLSPLSKIVNPEHFNQLKLSKYSKSNRVNDLLINKTIPVTLYDNLLTFRDTDKKFELEGDLLEMITNKNHIVDLDHLPVRQLMFELAKEMYFDEKHLGKRIIRNKSITRLLKSPAIMVFGISTTFLPENAAELCDRSKYSLMRNKLEKIVKLLMKKLLHYFINC